MTTTIHTDSSGNEYAEYEADWLISGEPGASVSTMWRGIKIYIGDTKGSHYAEYIWSGDRVSVGRFPTKRAGVNRARLAIDLKIQEHNLTMRFLNRRW